MKMVPDHDATADGVENHARRDAQAIISTPQAAVGLLGVLKANAFRPIALPTSSRGTKIETQLWRAGASNDCVAAWNALMIRITGKVAVLVMSATESRTARIAVIVFVLSKIGRRE